MAYRRSRVEIPMEATGRIASGPGTIYKVKSQASKNQVSIRVVKGYQYHDLIVYLDSKKVILRSR